MLTSSMFGRAAQAGDGVYTVRTVRDGVTRKDILSILKTSNIAGESIEDLYLQTGQSGLLSSTPSNQIGFSSYLASKDLNLIPELLSQLQSFSSCSDETLERSFSQILNYSINECQPFSLVRHLSNLNRHEYTDSYVKGTRRTICGKSWKKYVKTHFPKHQAKYKLSEIHQVFLEYRAKNAKLVASCIKEAGNFREYLKEHLNISDEKVMGYLLATQYLEEELELKYSPKLIASSIVEALGGTRKSKLDCGRFAERTAMLEAFENIMGLEAPIAASEYNLDARNKQFSNRDILSGFIRGSIQTATYTDEVDLKRKRACEDFKL